MTDSAEVTAAEIARLAGVGRAAVGNWRKRYVDFPKPVGGSTGSPTFRLADVERWLTVNNRAPNDEPGGKLRRMLLSTATDSTAQTQVLDLAVQIARQGKKITGLGPEVHEIVTKLGVAATFDLLLDAYVALPNQAGPTPAPLAELMAHLGTVVDDADVATVHDPACRIGTLLVAALGAGANSVTGQDCHPDNATMARLRLDLTAPRSSKIENGGLRHDAFSGTRADLVLCHPPFAVRDWGADDLAYDERWEYGVPSRQESELAWVQHCLARTRPGGTVVILLPPAVASRGSGRRIRAELLRRGALRAVVSLPPGTAAPSHLCLHLWLLKRPLGAAAGEAVLLVDASTVDPADLSSRLSSVMLGELGEIAIRLPVVDLLDDEVDLTPARHLAGQAGAVDAAEVLAQSELLEATLGDLAAHLPRIHVPDGPVALPMTTVGDLVRAGALTIHTAAGTAVEPNDILVAAAGPELRPCVATAKADLGPNQVQLRVDPRRLDAAFLAGFLGRPSNYRLVSSLGSTQRLDIRRATVPRIPLERQQAYGIIFDDLRTFRDRLVSTAEIGHNVANLIAEGLAAGTLGTQAFGSPA